MSFLVDSSFLEIVITSGLPVPFTVLDCLGYFVKSIKILQVFCRVLMETRRRPGGLSLSLPPHK